ncbi:hypothetical protein L218DRAFT_1009987 [Marasmius fiardii PR-910]|nr:hypothetical protein L218DRAFT_1009987 [Marasmius fiardii PR-910]
MMEDGDEGIVLSDLLRTGEASRLRRRGAIRDHIHRHPHHSPPPPSPEQTQTAYRLFCRGGETTNSSRRNEIARWSNEAFTPALFWSPTSGERMPSQNEVLSPTTMTGTPCGTLLHSSATSPASASSSYTAHTEPSMMVVPLDAVYFDGEEHTNLNLGVELCGCVREGLGCSNCGTPVGIRWKPCKPSSTAIYSFFSDAVYACPQPPKSTPPQPEPQAQAQTRSSRPPPRRRRTRIGEDEVNTALALLENANSSGFPSSTSPTSSSPSAEEELEEPIIDPSDPELVWALAMPWFGFSASLPEDLDACDTQSATRDFGVDALDGLDSEIDSIDDVQGYLERRISGSLLECRGDEEDAYDGYRYREEFDDYDYDAWDSNRSEERREGRLLVTVSDSLLQRTRNRSLSSPASPLSPSSPSAIPMTRSYAYSRFR